MAIMGRPKAKKENEVNACKALIVILEKLAGAKYELESCPDEEASKGKDVDFILKSTLPGTARMAVEHTVIQLSKEQLGYVISSFDRAENINKLCESKLPKDRYYLIAAPPALINSLKRERKQKAFDRAFSDWISQQAPQLRIDESGQFSYEGYRITLTCGGRHPEWNGRVGRVLEYPADVRKLQKEAFGKALRHGLDKFLKYKCSPCEPFKTALILEDVAGFRHGQILEGMTSSDKEEIDKYIDYIVVLTSSNYQMVAGYIWKENETWHGFIPLNRRFDDKTWLSSPQPQCPNSRT